MKGKVPGAFLGRFQWDTHCYTPSLKKMTIAFEWHSDFLSKSASYLGPRVGLGTIVFWGF